MANKKGTALGQAVGVGIKRGYIGGSIAGVAAGKHPGGPGHNSVRGGMVGAVAGGTIAAFHHSAKQHMAGRRK